ncbi:hypothetical protein KBZ10_18000 [Streptomyces sp. F63]|uniref:hypothetical protein n=1 Tax=Streptomyces sp. F63 TaxID=2824887 RepID=UPI001B37CAC7|nr:hypothetical protein [Streptomyces sp. F63]MBQ0986369.1 hypothetical protein [Streptomyces sp. F63]
MTDPVTNPAAVQLHPHNPSRLTDTDRSFAEAFAEFLPDVIELDQGSETSVGDLTRAIRRAMRNTPAASRGIPTSSVRRLASAAGFKLRREDSETFVLDVRLKRR